MKPWMHAVVYQLTWFVTVLLGNVWALLWALPLAFTLIWRQPPAALAFVATVGLAGYGVDLALQAMGWVSFHGNTAAGPLWLLVLWLAFANVIWHLLYRIPGVWLQALLGAVSGPLSYYGGAVLGAAEPLSTQGLIAFGIWWAIAFPAFVALRKRWPAQGRTQWSRP
ncbi:DUF2878 domain-containing protein [Natronospirillum operosum]|uniref:DUF2878 domain-containing protein n=1 Tax=Natronospirillum operosum TaxID=2759953 RepID=A0A4Z0WK18_9GAMM|nr:DUF2878 domain-containing protein [Natronospirillum operosum]TGG95535.1 DUF2878 domain-containing protein [Natronospirillum operosum]